MNKEQLLKIIKQHQWQKFLTRPYGLSFVHIHARAYHQILQQLTGPNFKTLYISQNGLVNIYRDAESAEKIKNNFFKLTINKEQLITTFRTIISYYNKIRKINFIDFNQRADFLAHLTALPFNIGNTIIANNLQQIDVDYKKILSMLTKIRCLNYYHKFGQSARSEKQNFICLVIGKRGYFTFDKLIINEVLKIFITANQELAKNNDQNIIKGKIAFHGKVIGKAIIIKNVTDMVKFSAGDILVSHSTNPELLPIIRIAGAIVTDEGGLMSHAAILAREFKIPSIIGTGYASRILKDGDMVKVDAYKGVVIKLTSRH